MIAENRATVFKAHGWNRWACMSQNRLTEWHRSKLKAIKDGLDRIGGCQQPHTIKNTGKEIVILKGGASC